MDEEVNETNTSEEVVKQYSEEEVEKLKNS